ncbi:MAG: hypothetical protein H0T84_12645 [Tatlockia sp.]|nr:hypothetical protein [Tatlockia sp.]
MKNVISLLIGGSLILATSVGFAAEKHHAGNNWTCTTNASSAATDAEKAADKRMEKPGSAAKAYKYALQNCRDCTQITCEVKK